MSPEEARIELLRSMVQAWADDQKLPIRFTYADAEALVAAIDTKGSA